MTTPFRLVFFGTDQFSVPTLEAVLEAGYNVAAIVTKPDAPKGRGKKLYIHPIKQIGLDHNIPVLQPNKLSEIEAELKNLQANAAVLVSYGKIIPGRILDLFEPIGIINLHPSLLPKYRGPSPIEAAILAGDKSTAISIMKLDTGMDTGPVFVQKEVVLSGQETKPELSSLLAKEGAKVLVQTLPDILSGKLQASSQEDNDVSVTSIISKADGILDPSTEDATTLERKVRAYQGFPKPRLNLFGHDVIVTSSSVVKNESDDALVLPCDNQTWLRIDSLVAPSGRTMSGEAFLRGYAK